MRNRHIGRTFIEGNNRADRVRMKFSPLREVLEGKRVILVEDSIVRSTTLKSLLSMIRDRGRAKEVHVRVACPPIIAPCFYGIDMSTIGELYAPRFMRGKIITIEEQKAMARDLGADSLFYLPLDAVVPRCIPFAQGTTLPWLSDRRISDRNGGETVRTLAVRQHRRRSHHQRPHLRNRRATWLHLTGRRTDSCHRFTFIVRRNAAGWLRLGRPPLPTHPTKVTWRAPSMS